MTNIANNCRENPLMFMKAAIIAAGHGKESYTVSASLTADKII